MIEYKSRNDTTDSKRDFCAIVIGTGFAGAVTACRLVEAGFDVCVLERGRRYGREDFPRYPTDELFAGPGEERNFAPPPDFSRWLWSQDHGLYDIRDLGATVAVQAAGYGGGSLIYANVHLRPPDNVFAQGWPEDYTAARLRPYFDLAAYMLGATPIPVRLAKTLQLKRAAEPQGSWFRTPLAVNFTADGDNAFGREQHPCDMRARCWRGCDHQAKNTLDLNYLARAEDGGCEIRTMTEVTSICRDGGLYRVYFRDLLLRDRDDGEQPAKDDKGHKDCKGCKERKECKRKNEPHLTAGYVFLCAGAVNTTQLLLQSAAGLSERGNRAPGLAAPLGSHYFPNSDSLAVAFDCDQTHEPDYGPTITSALLFDRPAQDEFPDSLDFVNGLGAPRECSQAAMSPAAGTTVRSSSGGTAVLAHDPILDWGTWRHRHEAAGALVLKEIQGVFRDRDALTFGNGATALARSGLVKHQHWLLVEDGGYPPDLEPLVGVFRSPLWLRRNRFLESAAPPGASSAEPEEYAAARSIAKQATPLRRPPPGRLRVEAFTDALGGTSSKAFAAEGTFSRNFSARQPTFGGAGANGELLLPGLLGQQLDTVLPGFFVEALANIRRDLLGQAAAFSLPLLGRLLDELSATVTKQIDPAMRARLSYNKIEDGQLQVLVRGLLRQALQVLAGSEVAVADKAAEIALNPVPGTPGQIIDLIANVVLWILGYDTVDGHTAVLLTMGRDTYRGRLRLERDKDSNERDLKATLPTRLLDTTSGMHERILRDIVSDSWRGELRTNPGWTTLGKRVTVHSQGGCPMGRSGVSVTNAEGEVYGCEGLYVMDAAAFPTSVGVNPSATIAAIAEYKVEMFIRKTDPKGCAPEHDETRPPWRARDHEDARRWMKRHGRETLDPLNAGAIQSRHDPPPNVLGMTFEEEMSGFYTGVEAGRKRIDFSDLETFPRNVTTFVNAESAGISAGGKISVSLQVTASDLARVISAEQTVEPPKMTVRGTLTVHGQNFEVIDNSFLQMFVRAGRSAATKFFRYHLHYRDDGTEFTLDGLKVLRDAPGFDSWHDTSTVYFEMSSRRGPFRGILRVSVEAFVRKQLPSMKITGTDDPARRSWALVAFYKYFAGELASIYIKRADMLTDAFVKLVTGIHV